MSKEKASIALVTKPSAASATSWLVKSNRAPNLRREASYSATFSVVALHALMTGEWAGILALPPLI